MSDDDNKSLQKQYEVIEKKVKRNANEAMTKASKELKKISKETKQIADMVKEGYKNDYEDMERKAIRAMTDVMDKAKTELDQLTKEAQGESSSTEELKQRIDDLQKSAIKKLAVIKRESEQAFDNNIKSKLQEVCPDNEDYYKCTLNEAYKKASSLFEEQRKQFTAANSKTYSSIMKEFEKSYSNITKASRNRRGSTSDNQGTSSSSKSSKS